MVTMKKKLKSIKPKKILTHFKPQVRSMHPSHKWLKVNLPNFKFRAIIRLGSTTSTEFAYPGKTPEQIAHIKELNKVQGIKNSSSKLLMKQCFTRASVKTADCFTKTTSGTSFLNMKTDLPISCSELPYPIISKSLHGSRGEGNTKHDNQQQLEAWMRGKDLSNYIFEKFYTYSREYRLHISRNGCFYTCRKLVRNDAPEGTWQRHDDVCTWILEENASFKKPRNWDAIVADCQRAQVALGLDICAFDVMVQSSKDGVERENPEWIICESCSAPSFGEITKVKYKEEIIRLLNN